jgi:hypothetical protein
MTTTKFSKPFPRQNMERLKRSEIDNVLRQTVGTDVANRVIKAVTSSPDFTNALSVPPNDYRDLLWKEHVKTANAVGVV